MRHTILIALLVALSGLGPGVSADDPAAAVEKLLKELDDDSPSVRQDATEKMILLWGDPAARSRVEEGIQRGLKTGSPEVQGRCVWIDETIAFCRSFGEFVPDAVGIDSLYKLLGADDPTALTLFEKWTLTDKTREACGFKEERQLAFLSRYVSGRLKTRPGKLRFIEFVHRRAGAGCAEGVAALFEDEDTEVRMRAIEALGWWLELKPYVKQIARHLQDPDNGPRAAATLALCRLEAREYLPQIRKMMKDDPDSLVRDRALLGLSELAPKECARDVEALLKHEDARVRAQAVQLLGRADPGVYADRLVEMLKDKADWPRIYAAYALRGLRDPKYRRAVAEMLATMPDHMQATDASVRLGALVTIGALDEGRQYDASVLAALKDDGPEVREFAVTQIAKWGDRKYASDLAPLLKDPSDEVRGIAALTLGELKAREYTKEIAPLLKDGNAWARGFAARALAMLEAKESIPDIALLLKDPDPQARGSAAVALGKLGAREFAADIAALRADSEPCRLFDEEWKIYGDSTVGSIATRVLERLGVDPDKK